MSILDSVPGIVAATAGQLLFKDATVRGAPIRTSDGRGGHLETPTTAEACKALVTDYSSFQRAQAGIPSNERLILVQAHELSLTLAPGHEITIDGRTWHVVDVSIDPAGAVYEARAR